MICLLYEFVFMKAPFSVALHTMRLAKASEVSRACLFLLASLPPPGYPSVIFLNHKTEFLFPGVFSSWLSHRIKLKKECLPVWNSSFCLFR